MYRYGERGQRKGVVYYLVCAEEHKTREKVSIVTDWEVERVGSPEQVILDGRAQCTQVSEDVVRVDDHCLKKIDVNEGSKNQLWN